MITCITDSNTHDSRITARRLIRHYITNATLSLLLWLIPFALSGQRYISGCVTSAENDYPISGASVYIDNTTIGTATDPDGNYRLRIPGEGSYRLIVSHVGFQPVSNDIEPGNLSMEVDVTMYPNELDEVTVTSKVRFRQTDINLFWSMLLGRKPSKKTIYAINPEVVYYYYNPETRILKVTCREPLQIINNETGYFVQFDGQRDDVELCRRKFYGDNPVLVSRRQRRRSCSAVDFRGIFRSTGL